MIPSYHYDAFGVERARTGNTPNDYLFAGEQFDRSLNQLYLRNRYYNQDIGRFTQMDTFQGVMHDPMSLHKYLYTPSDPVNFTDPSGRFFGFTIAQNINAVLTTASVVATGFEIYSYATGEKEFNARNVGFTALILLSGPAAGKLIKLGVAAHAARAIETAIKSGNLGRLLLKGGRTSEVILKRFIPSGTKNTFVPSVNIKSGFKYQFKIGKVDIEIKWHSPDLRAAKNFPGSNSGSMWTAQIKINNKFLLGTDGKLHSKPSNITHIPIDIF